MTIPSPRTSHDPAAFDRAAATYDDDFDALPEVQRVRDIVGSIILRHFTQGMHILELNCGTGTDAVMMGNAGMRVTATDVSTAMVQESRTKVQAHNLATSVHVTVLDLQNLSALGGPFDGVLSNFGGLNCVKDIVSVARGLERIVRPGGVVILNILSDFCFIETIAFLLRGDFDRAFARMKTSGTTTRIKGTNVNVFYHSPRYIRETFLPDFECIGQTGLNILTPPPSFRRWYRFRSVFQFLAKLDDLLCRMWPFSRIGDHIVIVLRRKRS